MPARRTGHGRRRSPRCPARRVHGAPDGAPEDEAAASARRLVTGTKPGRDAARSGKPPFFAPPSCLPQVPMRRSYVPGQDSRTRRSHRSRFQPIKRSAGPAAEHLLRKRIASCSSVLCEFSPKHYSNPSRLASIFLFFLKRTGRRAARYIKKKGV